MELVVQLLFVLAVLSSVFQMSHWRFLPRLISGLLFSMVAYLSYPWIIEQSTEQFNLWLGDTIIMQNLAVVQVIEAIFFIGIDLSMLKKYFGESDNKYKYYASYFPGIMLLVAILYAQMMYFYSFSEVDFNRLGIYFSIGVGAVIILSPIAVKWVIPENHLRMELRYILSFGQILGAVIITVFCQVLPYHQQEIELELNPLLGILGLVFIMFLIGWGWSMLKRRLKLKWKF